MSDILKYFEGDRFAKHCGIILTEAAPHRACAHMAIRDEHRNGHGVVHGGAIFTLADFTGAAACNALGKVSLAINASIIYQHPGQDGTLWAEAEVVGSSNKLATVKVNIYNDDRTLIATFQGMAFRKEIPVP